MEIDSTYQSIDTIVAHKDGVMTASEAHGVLIGMICWNDSMDCDAWLLEVFEDEDHKSQLNENEWQVFNTAYDETRKILTGGDFAFELILPADNMPLTERACALADWCKGFLFGLGLVGEEQAWPNDCDEFLRDVIKISRLEYKSSEEADEVAYMELTEYVRIGAQFVVGEIRWSEENS